MQPCGSSRTVGDATRTGPSRRGGRLGRSSSRSKRVRRQVEGRLRVDGATGGGANRASEVDLGGGAGGLNRVALPGVTPEGGQHVDECKPFDPFSDGPRRPRACPRSMMERTMSSSRPPASSICRREVNVRSSFSSPTANSFRCEIEEKPVPKSSIETRIPESVRLWITRLDREPRPCRRVRQPQDDRRPGALRGVVPGLFRMRAARQSRRD